VLRSNQRRNCVNGPVLARTGVISSNEKVIRNIDKKRRETESQSLRGQFRGKGPVRREVHKKSPDILGGEGKLWGPIVLKKRNQNGVTAEQERGGSWKKKSEVFEKKPGWSFSKKWVREAGSAVHTGRGEAKGE